MIEQTKFLYRPDRVSAPGVTLLDLLGERGMTQVELAERTGRPLGAVSAWLRQGELEGEKIICKPFNKERLLDSMKNICELTLEEDLQVFIPKLVDICSECGIAIVFIEPFSKTAVYGASCWLNPEKALIQLSSRGKTTDILWFTIFHEIGHIIKHSKKEIFIEIEDKSIKKSQEEFEADEYAAETLIPSLRLNEWLKINKQLNAAIISNFAKELNIAPGILVGRLQHMKRVRFSDYNGLKFRYDWCVSEANPHEQGSATEI